MPHHGSSLPRPYGAAGRSFELLISAAARASANAPFRVDQWEAKRASTSPPDTTVMRERYSAVMLQICTVPRSLNLRENCRFPNITSSLLQESFSNQLTETSIAETHTHTHVTSSCITPNPEQTCDLSPDHCPGVS